MQAIAASRWVAPLRALGRQGLPVFATGTALSLLFQAVKAGVPENVLIDAAILVVGLGIQLALAYALNHTAAMKANLARAKAA
jgi:hypothetical protein